MWFWWARAVRRFSRRVCLCTPGFPVRQAAQPGTRVLERRLGFVQAHGGLMLGVELFVNSNVGLPLYWFAKTQPLHIATTAMLCHVLSCHVLAMFLVLTGA